MEKPDRNIEIIKSEIYSTQVELSKIDELEYNSGKIDHFEEQFLLNKIQDLNKRLIKLENIRK